MPRTAESQTEGSDRLGGKDRERTEYSSQDGLSEESLLVGRKKKKKKKKRACRFPAASTRELVVGLQFHVIPRSDSSESSTACPLPATRDDGDGRQQRRRPTVRPPHSTTRPNRHGAKGTGSLDD